MSYFPSISQNVTVDTANSYSGTILAGVTWNSAGVGTSTLGVAGIQIVIGSTENAIVYVDQGRTSSSFQITDTYDYNVIKGNFGITVQAIGAYVRVRVKNIGASTATVVVDTVLCPIVEAVPRSLDENQLFKTAVYEVSDEFGHKLLINNMGAMSVAEPYRLVGTPFGTANDAIFWTPTNNGTSSLAAVGAVAGGTNAMATLKSGTSNNGYGNITSVRSGRYIIGNSHLVRALVRIVGLTKTGCTRRWGAYSITGTPPTPVNGFFYSVSDTDVLSVNAYNSGSASVASVSSGSFNGVKSQFVIDENVHKYEILYSAQHTDFIIDDTLYHSFLPTTVHLAADYSLPFVATAVNSAGGTTSGTLELWRGAIHRLGRPEASPAWRNIHGANAGTQLKLGPGRLHSLTINTAGNSSAISLYDATSATNPIALVTGLQSTSPPVELHYNIDFYTGLYIVTTIAATDITISFE